MDSLHVAQVSTPGTIAREERRTACHSPSLGIMKRPKRANDNDKDAAKQKPAASNIEERRKVIEEYAQSLREYVKWLRNRLN